MTVEQSSPPRPPRRRPAPIRVQVARVHQVAPRLVRIAFTGPEMHRFVWPGPGSHLKVFLPEPGADDVALPEPDADGMVTFDRPLTSRTYTPRRYDEHAGELEIDFVVHGHGPASRWAAAAQPGDRAAVSIPRATYQVSPDATGLLLAGDESALPAIATILASCPAGLPARVLAEVHSADDQTALPGAATIDWLHRGDEPAGSLLERALGEAAPAAGTAVWVATEASVVRRIRALLLDGHGLPRERVVTRGYWRVDTANHPDHDFGEEEIPTR